MGHTVIFCNLTAASAHLIIYLADTLLRDGQILHVQIDPFNRMDLELLEEYSEYTSRLTSIQIMLDDIEFGRGDWLYILRDADGNSRFVYKRKPRWITNFIWAPYIDENEIQFTKWDLFGTREGFSNSEEHYNSIFIYVSNRFVERKRSGCI